MAFRLATVVGIAKFALLAPMLANAAVSGSARIAESLTVSDGTNTISHNLNSPNVTGSYTNTLSETTSHDYGTFTYTSSARLSTDFSQDLAAGRISGSVDWTDSGWSASTTGQIDARYVVTGQPYAYKLTITAPGSTMAPYSVQFGGYFENPADAIYLQYVSGPISISQSGIILANPDGAAWDTFWLIVQGIGCAQNCIGDSSNNLTFTLELTPLASFKLSSSTVAGCKSVRGTIGLFSPAPVGGFVLTVSDTLAAASVPETVTVPAGATSKSFIIKTVPVTSNQSGTVTVGFGAGSLSQPLTVRPMGLTSLTVKPTTVAGSQPAAGTAKLECKAGPGPITVDLSSSNPSVAYPVATGVVIPQGVQSQTFTVGTNAALAKTYAMITGEANGTTKTRKLNVTPAAEVSPRSLMFGNVTVGTTSGTLTTTLTNKGAAPFVIDSIGITGSYASWFSQTNNCPSSLPAGAACTVAVTFRPALVAKKSAKLSIATSATSTPLSVSLSGTGT